MRFLYLATSLAAIFEYSFASDSTGHTRRRTVAARYNPSKVKNYKGPLKNTIGRAQI